MRKLERMKIDAFELWLLLAAGVHTGQIPFANARTVLGEVTKTDSWGAALPPPLNTGIRFPAVAGHYWSRCSSVSASMSQWGQIEDKFDSTMLL